MKVELLQVVVIFWRFKPGNMAERINRIKEVLVIQGRTQLWLAQKLGKSATSVTAICNNKSQPHLKELKRIAAILDVDIRELLVATK